MRRIRFVPGVAGIGVQITIPDTAPDIGSVVAAEITRPYDAFTVAHGGSGAPLVHADGVVVPHTGLAVADHADHSHDIDSTGTGIAPVIPLGWDNVVPTQLEDFGAVALHTWAGGGATGIQDTVIAAHAVTPNDDHEPADIAAALIHNAADIAAALLDHVTSGVTPAVGVIPAAVTSRIITLDAATELGDLLTLAYNEVGERVLVS